MGKTYSNIKTGVIGVGSMGQNHARVYSEISNLVGVSDLNKQQGEKIANRFDVSYYENFEDLLNKVDAVSIAVPTQFHLDVSKKVINKKIPFLMEKPLSNNSENAKKILNMANSKDVTMAMGHIERHNDIITYAKEKLDSGDWGEVITMSAKRFSNFPDRIKDVGVLLDLSIHDIDIIRYLMGSEIISLYSTGGRHNNTVFEDHVAVSMNFKNGKIGICETNWLTPMKVRELGITTTTHHIKLDYIKQEIEISTSLFKKIDYSNLYLLPMEIKKQRISLQGQEPLKRELFDFLNAVSTGASPLVSGEDGLKAVEIIESAIESLNSKTVIEL